MLNKSVNILALHGFTGCGEDFSEFSPFCDKRLRWFCPDLLGHGSAPKCKASTEATIDYIDSLAKELPKNQPCILLGYSMGARAALLHALENKLRPWNALILISGSAGIQNAEKRRLRILSDEKLCKQIKDQGLRRFLDYWQKLSNITTLKNIDPLIRENVMSNRLQNDANGLVNSLQYFGQGCFPSLWPRLKELECPTLLITGSKDEKYSVIAHKLNDEISNSQLSVINSSGHMPHLEKPRETALAINHFLNNTSFLQS